MPRSNQNADDQRALALASIASDRWRNDILQKARSVVRTTGWFDTFPSRTVLMRGIRRAFKDGKDPRPEDVIAVMAFQAAADAPLRTIEFMAREYERAKEIFDSFEDPYSSTCDYWKPFLANPSGHQNSVAGVDASTEGTRDASSDGASEGELERALERALETGAQDALEGPGDASGGPQPAC